jgi:hypothetical protein
VLAAPAPSMRDALLRAAFSSLGAALVLTPLAPAMRDAALRAACSSCLGAALVLAAPAPAMRLALLRAAVSSLLRATLLLTLPLAHCAPPGSSNLLGVTETPTHCDIPFTAVPHPPLSPQRSEVHTGHQTHDGGSARAGQTLQHVSIKMVKSVWAGDVRWVCSRGGWPGTPPQSPPPGSQAACTLSSEIRLIGRVGFGTGRQRMTLERGTTPMLSYRTCSPRYGLQSG